MSNLSEEQIKKLMDNYDLTREKVLELEKLLIRTFNFQVERVEEQISNFFINLKPILKEIDLYKKYKREREDTLKFFKKKKSQRKNWKKWKLR